VKISTGILSLILLCVIAAPAQQTPPSPPDEAAASQSAPPASDQQTQPTATPQTPPDQQTPPPARPQTGTIRQPPPPLPKVPDIRQPGETGYWIGADAWFPTQHPTFDKGRGSTFTTPSKLEMQGKPKLAWGGEIGIAIGLHNALRFSYWEDRAAGDFTSTTELRVWNQDYPAGSYISTNYRLQNAKISFDYLTWPYPVERRKFRLKTLWGVQYTGVRTVFDLPTQPLVDPTTGAPILDASGNPVSYAAEGSRWFISPDIGIGVAQWVSRNFRLEANAAGFTIPRHTTNWDADATANVRYGHLEIRVGAKAFHFKTSTDADFYIRGTQASAFVGLRWYSD
jgi:hypothetical protein